MLKPSIFVTLTLFLLSLIYTPYVSSSMVKMSGYVPQNRVVVSYKASELRVEEDKLSLDPQVARGQILEEYQRYGLPLSIVSQFVDVIIPRESRYLQYAKSTLSSSKGILQWLDSSFLGYGCIGSAYDWRSSIECSVRAYKINGLNDWAVTPQSISGKI